MRHISTCIDCGSNHWVGTGGKRYCAQCGSDRVREIMDTQRKGEPQGDIGHMLLGVTKRAIKHCATYDVASKTIQVDHKRIRAIIDNATEALRLIQDIANG